MAYEQDWNDTNEWQPDYFECESPLFPSNPHLHADNEFPSWSNEHLEQLEHFWALCREYCRANQLPILDDSVTFAAFVRSLSPLNRDWRAKAIRRHMVCSPVRTSL